MSNFRKILLLTSVAAAVSLSACGGSDSPAPGPVAADVPAITITPATAVAARSAAAALIAAPAITLPAITPATGPAIPAGTTLKFTALPTGAPATALSGFTLTSGAAAATGVLTAGSCIFTVSGPATGGLYAVGTVLTFNPCSIDLNTAGATSTTTSIPVSVALGTTTISVTAPVTVTITNGVATVSSGGQVVSTGSVVTGS